ncbi:uncharacterized protein KY384_008287 [Bacidia gigantensis]|uniref:uncharacterized protein n=1 Tax=Bacidia gigantensis TaxID=2732470 RepID=UPI001D036B30|nr:uncharacterized protein KY384_008287 [Bacidia gigantensis]KAG8526858.1 hypothetical protein KY384_008287 [Bacidia gigantensis]
MALAVKSTDVPRGVKRKASYEDVIPSWAPASPSLEDCGKSFLTATRLRRHFAAHEGREKFKCTVVDCGETFRKHSTLQVHITKVHEGKKPFICAFLDDDGKRCNAGFDTASKLKDHEGRLHEIKRYVCSICSDNEGQAAVEKDISITFSTFSALQEHLAQVHPPTCSECGLKNRTQAELKRHIELFHSGLDLDQRRKYICPKLDCGRGFTTKGNLNQHIKSFHGEKQFICEATTSTDLKGLEAWDGNNACGGHFTSKRRLVEHIRNIHCGLRTKPAGKPRNEKRARKKASAIDQLTASSTMNDVYAHPSLQGYVEHVSYEDLVAERALDACMTAANDIPKDDEGFWLGGINNEGMTDSSTQWLQDETNMRQLIDDEFGVEGMDAEDTPGLTVDPKLI